MTRIVGISSGKGGVGKTTFTTNLAIALSKLGQKVIVVDCNVTTPHLSYYLGAGEYTGTLNDVLKGDSNIKEALSQESGVMFVPASTNLEDLQGMDIMALKSHVKKLDNGMIDFVLLDSAPGLGREALSVLKAADELIFISTPTIPVLKDIERSIEVSKELGDKKLHLVLNMSNLTEFRFKTQQIEDMFKIPVLGEIFFDKNVVHSTALGMPLLKHMPSAKPSKQIMSIAANLVGKEFKPSFKQTVTDALRWIFLGR